MHKKHGFSDLGIKSLRGLRRDCIGRLGALIEELLGRLGALEAPMPPEQQIELLENKLEAVRQKMHELVDLECSRLR
jgi:hypothetical protein